MSLEARNLLSHTIRPEELKADILAELKILAADQEKEITLEVAGEESFAGDKEVILEVVENLLSNALRYAKEQIGVRVSMNASELRVRVKDDGNGFQEEGETVTKAFHQQNVKDSLKHAGMGMYISRLYCEKHGGKLLLENEEEGGAAITAIFRRI